MEAQLLPHRRSHYIVSCDKIYRKIGHWLFSFSSLLYWILFIEILQIQIKRIKANISDLFPRRFWFLHLTFMFSFLVLLPLSISHLIIFIKILFFSSTFQAEAFLSLFLFFSSSASAISLLPLSVTTILNLRMFRAWNFATFLKQLIWDRKYEIAFDD